MKQTINSASQFRDAFRAAGRQDQFSYEALGLLFDHLEECNPDYELDVIALCCEYSHESWRGIASDYDIDVDGVTDDDVDIDAYMSDDSPDVCQDDLPGICEACSGSGEGMHDNSVCPVCKGLGE